MRFSGVINLVVAIFFCSEAFSTQMIFPDFEEQVRNSDLIVQGKVEKIEGCRDNERILTKVLISPLDIIRCRDCGKDSIITVIVPGGDDGRFVQFAVGAPTFAEGEEVILFLVKSGSSYIVNSLSLGKWTVHKQNGKKMVTRRIQGVKFFEKIGSGLAPISVPESETRELDELIKKIKEIKY